MTNYNFEKDFYMITLNEFCLVKQKFVLGQRKTQNDMMVRLTPTASSR